MRRIDMIICRAAPAAPFHLLSVPTAFASTGSLAYRGTTTADTSQFLNFDDWAE